ncbi:MAG: hypothetical protein JSW00_00070 [Thermoplasmata archaeon]|nr:MAG: hypothetical protein JSW00_00070 [Thermoplasmata archaeon]
MRFTQIAAIPVLMMYITLARKEEKEAKLNSKTKDKKIKEHDEDEKPKEEPVKPLPLYLEQEIDRYFNYVNYIIKLEGYS